MIMNRTIKVAVGLSGGVDSAVAAALLQEQGYEVTGVFLLCYRGPGCRTDEDRKEALDVALKLEIPFEVLDFRKEYQEKVLEYFKAEYEAGRTPNPDVVCNREIKFGLFYEWVLKKEFDYVATGHYACVRSTQDTRFELLIPKEKRKDQTYFLYQLREEQLRHILFPIGGMTKDEVRHKAKELKLPVAKKPDSQGICFVGEVGVKQFLQRMGVKEKRGEVANVSGKVVGEHKGVWFYTIGQRHGFEVKNVSPQTKPLYIFKKDLKKNILVVGTREACMRREFEVGEVYLRHETRSTIQDLSNVKVRIRHGGQLILAKIVIRDSRLMVQLAKPVFGVAPGQSVVFYNREICLGGGVISA
ncbi:tRNA 2-thiouridine(34) synthase MnmA [Microgenomates group bacterium RBG_16_45_19]|nr:MAG: tRNA 2-thiouridine(34) synthase MnmA [Microgenomates group bacterium RBG_16_45_19]